MAVQAFTGLDGTTQTQVSAPSLRASSVRMRGLRLLALAVATAWLAAQQVCAGLVHGPCLAWRRCVLSLRLMSTPPVASSHLRRHHHHHDLIVHVLTQVPGVVAQPYPSELAGVTALFTAANVAVNQTGTVERRLVVPSCWLTPHCIATIPFKRLCRDTGRRSVLTRMGCQCSQLQQRPRDVRVACRWGFHCRIAALARERLPCSAVTLSYRWINLTSKATVAGGSIPDAISALTSLTYVVVAVTVPFGGRRTCSALVLTSHAWCVLAVWHVLHCAGHCR